MSLSAVTATSTPRAIAPFLSVVGGAIVVAGFHYPSLFVEITRGCFPRICHQVVLQYTFLSGAQIMTIDAHPLAPPFIWFIIYPPGILSLLPLMIGGFALLASLGELVYQPAWWLLILHLCVDIIGLLFLGYDSFLWWSSATYHFNGAPARLMMPSTASAGHVLLYLGYLLLMGGIVWQLRRPVARM